MYGREKLEVKELIDGNGFGFSKGKADNVMDAMERRIARLTALVEGWKRNSVELGKMYKRRLAMEQARNNELDVALCNAVTGGQITLERAKMLEKKLEDVQNTMATENVDLGMENHKLKERIKELENEIQLIEKNTDYWADRYKELEAIISIMETTTPKWISVDDELPKEGEEVIAFYTSWKHEYQQVAMFESGEFIDLGGCALSPTHWMQLPPPPTTEEK